MRHIPLFPWLPAALLFFLAPALSGAQTATNVRVHFDQFKQVMLIHYDLKGLNYRKEMYVSPRALTGDSTYLPVKSLSGDLGWINRGGKNKLIVWDPFKDGFSSLKGIQVELETEIRTARLPPLWSVAWHGSNSAPLGLKIARLDQFGFYAAFRVNRLPLPYRYITKGDSIDYRASGVYHIGTKSRLASFAITGGPTFQVARTVYAYAGFGYGAEQEFWEYDEYNLDKEFVGSAWALHENINSKGPVLELGAMIRLGRVSFEVGVSAVNFDAFQITGGLGLCFHENLKSKKN